MYWTKYLWYCWDFSSTPAVIRRPHSDSAPVELFPFSHPRCASGLRRRIFILCEKKPAYESFDQAIHSGTLIAVSQLAMDFSNLWKDCYRFIMLLFTQCTRYTWLTAISSHCLAALPTKMSVFNSHMQGSHSVISNKRILYTKKNVCVQ